MHQVHHSLEHRHWDKNMGFVFSLWDRLFGTLYVPKSDEQFRLGLPVGSGRFDTVLDLFVDPFVRSYRRLVRATSSARQNN
jgi:sterol desaturase/sphingolipid hydroxylase (fatty acid hydroxylase superfamily)